MLRASLLFVVIGPTLLAQPFIFYRGIVNAASFAPEGLPNGSIARGSIFSIFGRNLGPAQGSTVSSFPLGAVFENVSIEVCQNANCVAALPLFVSAGQINAIMPSNAPLGGVSLRVSFNGQAGNFSPANVVASSLGIFAINSGGFGPGIVQNFTPEALTVNSAVATARPGQTVIAWGTGLGAGLNADNVAPQSGDLPVNVEIWAGGRQATVRRYSGRSPCCAGVDQIIFDLPPDIPSGCYVPVQVRAGGVVSNSITMAIASDNEICPEAADPITGSLLTGGRLGSVFLLRDIRERLEYGGKYDLSADVGLGIFSEELGGPWAFHPVYSQPPLGTCLGFASRGGLGPQRFPPTVRVLDAGEELTITVGAQSIPVSRDPRRENAYALTLGAQVPEFDFQPVLDPPGLFRVEGAGGPDVGPFTVTVGSAAPVDWTNRAQIVEIDRASDLTLTWADTTPASDEIWIWGGATDAVTDSFAIFSCSADPASKAFTIPSYVLSAVPVSRVRESQSSGWLAIGGLSENRRQVFGANGLDTGAVVSLVTVSKTVRYR
jgi:uncharacterized protein (TIGR03437 family)